MDHVIAVSQELGGDLVGGIGLSAERVTVIPNGIDTREYKIEDDASSRSPTVIGVGRLSRQKDFATLIRAFARLPRALDARLVILGRGSDVAKARLEKLAARLGAAERVELAGHVDDVPARIADADLFVSSSRWEGSSNAVLEALATGTQVVATLAPTGIAEILGPLGEDHLVPVGDDMALAAAMERALLALLPATVMVARARDFDLALALGRYCEVLAEQLALARSS